MARPTARLKVKAKAKPGKPAEGIKSKASSRVTSCITTITSKVSRVRMCARITLAIEAFQASSSIAGAIHCSKGKARGSTESGAFIARSKGSAASSASKAALPPSQLLAPSDARATASA